MIETRLAVNADPDLIRSVMQNLLANAWKFAGDGKRPLYRSGKHST